MNNIIGIIILVAEILALTFYIFVFFGGMDYARCWKKDFKITRRGWH